MLITNVTGNFFLKENDTATEMHLAVQEVDGTPIDLSAASKVEVVIGTLEGRYLTKTPTLLDKTGEFTFGLDEGDMLPTGDNLLEVHIFDNNNSKRVAPSKGHYKLKVQRTIGALGLTVTTYTLDYFLSEVNRILFGLPQFLARGEALADRMDVLIEESEQVLDEMYTATDDSRTATANSIEATAAAELATQDAQRATVEADTATAEAIQATTEADNATRDSIAQTQAANTATSGANAATMRANTAAGEAEFQAFQAENATVDAQDATRAANTATDNANIASSRANTAAGRADTATTSANNAANAANTAATEANTARDSANLAASLADGIATELRGYDNSIATFSLETRYLKHHPVRFDGSTYKAKVETQGNPLPVAPARSNEWFDLVAEKGEKGDMGTGINILGKVGSVSELPASGSPGDAYLIGVNIHIWDGDGWLDGGPIQGPQGEIGPQGEVGVGLQYSWNGSQLGVKRADESTYTYRDLQGPQGLKGDNAKIITLDFIIPATDGTQVDGNLINVHDYVYDAATDSIQFYQNSRILYPGEDFEMEDGTFRLLNWTGYDDPANVTFYIKVTRSVFDIDPVQSHATVVGALGYTPARSEDITQVVYDLEEADTRLTAQLEQVVINVKNFGAKGDGMYDDAPAIRAAYAHLKSLGGGTLYFPHPEVNYNIQSTVNHGGFSVGLVHDSDNISFQGASVAGGIRASVEMHAVIYAVTSAYYTSFDKIYISANNLANYCFASADNVYNPYMSVVNSRFYNAKEFAFKVATYVSNFTKCIFANSKGGFLITGTPENIATSTTINSCYALNNTEVGFKSNLLMYSTFNSCAADNMPNGIAYDLNGRGIVMNGCGAEKVRQVFRITSFRGFTINSFFGFNVGSTDSLNPTQHLFEFVTGLDASVSGIHIQNGSDRHYKYKLGLTQSSYGFENITVVDDSVRRHEAYFVPNYKFERPIKFVRGDETSKSETVTLNVDELTAHLSSIAHLEINHVYTIKLNDGVQNMPSKANEIFNMKGTGKLIIEGNSADRTLVKIVGAYQRLFLKNSSVSIEFKNLTIENRSSSGYNHIIDVDNCPNIVLNNVSLNNSGFNAGAAVLARNGSHIKLINGTLAEGAGSFGTGGVFKMFDFDSSSSIALDDGTAPPTAGAWQKGMKRINSSPNAGGFVGWICTTTARPGTWKGYGLIEA